MDAKQARINAEIAKNQVTDVDHLHNHFVQLIKKASNQGKFEIEKQTFAADRFRQTVIDEVIALLQGSGYKVLTGKNNAMNQIILNVSW